MYRKNVEKLCSSYHRFHNVQFVPVQLYQHVQAHISKKWLCLSPAAAKWIVCKLKVSLNVTELHFVFQSQVARPLVYNYVPWKNKQCTQKQSRGKASGSTTTSGTTVAKCAEYKVHVARWCRRTDGWLLTPAEEETQQKGKKWLERKRETRLCSWMQSADEHTNWHPR